MSNYSTFPLVVLIDLDGTIIGDITPQIISYEVAKVLKKVHAKYSYDMHDLKTKLKNGLVRPYFEAFIKGLQSNNPNVEFFIYTASEKTWAEFIIKQIEQALGIKFNRPILSRSFCINQDKEYKKSLSLVMPTLLKTFKKKYTIPYSKRDLLSNILMIDNNNVYQHNDQKHLLLCPTYNYRIPENIVANIKLDTFKSNHSLLHSILKKYMSLSNTNDFLTFQKEFYTYYVNYLSSITKSNLRHTNDKFWLHLKDIIISQNIKVFDEKNVRYINTLLRHRIYGSRHGNTLPVRKHTQTDVRAMHETRRVNERSNTFF
jgi:hypothetical protein